MTFYDKARSMFSHSTLVHKLWGEAAYTRCFFVIISSSTTIECKTPFEVESDSHVDYSQLRVFGSSA